MIIRPRVTIIKFLKYDRSKLTKPVIFMLVCSLVYGIILSLFKEVPSFINAGGFDNKPITTAMFKWVMRNYGYTNLLTGVFMALWLQLLFRKKKYGYFEVLTVVCYILGILFLIFSLFSLIVGIFPSTMLIMPLMGYTGIFYFTLALGSFYGGKFQYYLLAFFGYLLGVISFFAIAASISLFLDFIF